MSRKRSAARKGAEKQAGVNAPFSGRSRGVRPTRLRGCIAGRANGGAGRNRCGDPAGGGRRSKNRWRPSAWAHFRQGATKRGFTIRGSAKRGRVTKRGPSCCVLTALNDGETKRSCRARACAAGNETSSVTKQAPSLRPNPSLRPSFDSRLFKNESIVTAASTSYDDISV